MKFGTLFLIGLLMLEFIFPPTKKSKRKNDTRGFYLKPVDLSFRNDLNNPSEISPAKVKYKKKEILKQIDPNNFADLQLYYLMCEFKDDDFWREGIVSWQDFGDDEKARLFNEYLQQGTGTNGNQGSDKANDARVYRGDIYFNYYINKKAFKKKKTENSIQKVFNPLLVKKQKIVETNEGFMKGFVKYFENKDLQNDKPDKSAPLLDDKLKDIAIKIREQSILASIEANQIRIGNTVVNIKDFIEEF